MATFRKRETKNGFTYDIQVKVKDRSQNKTVTKTMSWRPEYPMTEKQAERECARVAEKFEEDIKRMFTSSLPDIPDYNVTVAEMADKWLERVQHDFSVGYYEIGVGAVAWMNRYIGGYKIREVTPYIIQDFFDKLDSERYTTYTVTAKPAFKEVLERSGISYNKFRTQYKLNTCSLVHLIGGKSVSMEYASCMAKVLRVDINKIFKIEKTVRPYAAATIARVKRATRCIFAMAKRQRLVEDNFASADYVSYGRKPKRNIKYLDDQQAKELFGVIMEYDDIRAKTAIMLALMTGLRRGELAGLEWKDIDFVLHTLSVNRTGCYSISMKSIYTKEPKTEGSIRRITISELLNEQLKEYKAWYDTQRENWGDQWEDSDRLFVQETGKPINPSTIHFWLKKMLKKANLPDVTLHSLRHTNITLQIAAGVPLTTVAGRAGHSRVSTTSDIYSHFIRTSDEAAATAIEDIFVPRVAQEG